MNEVEYTIQAARQLANATGDRVAIYLTLESHLAYEMVNKLDQYERVLEVVSPEPDDLGEFLL